MKSSFQTVLLFVFGLVAVVAILMFAGIIPGARQESIGSAGTVTLWGTLPMGNDLTTFLAEFNESNKTSVKVTYKAIDPNRYEEELIQALASGNGPDLFFLPDDFIVKHFDKVKLIPYDSYPLRTFKDTFSVAGEIYLHPNGVVGVPVAVDPLVMYYNRPLVTSVGAAEAPRLWTDFLAIAKKLVHIDERRTLLQSALPFGEFVNYRNAKGSLLALMLQAGVEPVRILATEGEYRSGLASTLGQGTGPARAATEFFVQFADPAKDTYTWNKSMPEARDAFVSETLATYFGYQSELPVIQAKNPHLDFDVAIIPQPNARLQTTYGRVMGLAIAKTSPKTGVAFTALQLLTNKDTARKLADLFGLSPVRRDLLASPKKDVFEQVFYRSALIARGVQDPDSGKTTNILHNLVTDFQSGASVSGDPIIRADAELQLLIK